MVLRHLAAEAMAGLRRADIVGGRHGFAEPRGIQRHVLDLAGARHALLGRVAAQHDQDVGGQQRAKRRPGGRAVDARIGLLDMVTEVGAEPRALLERGAAGRIERRAVAGVEREADAQPARIASDLREERTLRGRRPIRIARDRPGGRVEQRGTIAHCERDGMLAYQPGDRLAEIGRKAVARAGRLQADEPAAGGGHPDRAEAVRGVRHRHHARRNRRGRAAARSTGSMLEMPRVARRPVVLRLAGDAQAELAGVGLAEDDQPGALVSPDQRAILRRHHIGEEVAAARRRDTAERAVQVLQQERNAAERSVRQAGRDRLSPVIVELHDDRIDPGIAGFDALDRGLEQLGGRDLPAPHQSREAEAVVGFELGKPHVDAPRPRSQDLGRCRKMR